MKRTIESLLELLATHGGTIESTASLNINDINQAKASGRLYVDENSLGYVWMPSVNDMFPETEDQVKQFEKWFPLDVELPKELENLDWMKKKKTPYHPLPDGYVEEGESEFDAMKWVSFDFTKTETHPPKYDRYLICRKDGKIHWETWNTSGWAYNHNEIRYWAKINKP